MASRNSILALLAQACLVLPSAFADTTNATGTATVDPSTDSSSSPASSAQSSAGTAPASSDVPGASSKEVIPAAGTGAGSRQSSALNPPSSAAALQGNVQGGAPVVLQGLHDVGVSVHHLQEMLKGLLYEAQRQDMVVVAEPNVIGPMIIPAIPNPSGMMSIGYLPPRKKWIDYFMSQIEEIIPMLDHEINSLPRPSQSESELLQAYVEMFDAARGFNPPWSRLESATKGPDYKNQDISVAGSELWFQIEKFKKLKDKVFKMVKAETKQKKKKES